MSSSQASGPQTTTLSQPSSSKAYKPWQKEEVERLIGWIEEHVDQMQGKRNEWAKQAKEEVFSTPLDDHITAKKIQDKARNMRTAYNKAKQMQLRSGWGLTEEDVEPSICDRLGKVCQFFWRLDGIWGQKPSTTPLSHFDSLAASGPDSPADTTIDVSPPVPSANDPSRFPSRSNSRVPSSQHGSQNALSDNDDDFDQDTPSVGQQFEYRSTRRRSQKSAMGPDFTEKLMKAQSAQLKKLLNQRLQHERELYTATLTSQERIIEIMASSQERTMQAVLTTLTSYRRRSDSSKHTRSRSRSASPARREA